MYYPHFYKTLNQEEIRKQVEQEGFAPIALQNSAGYIYEKHAHPETKLLIFLEGSMDVKVEGKVYHCIPGDKLIIPGNTLHSAVVGENGCTFFWSEKML